MRHHLFFILFIVLLSFELACPKTICQEKSADHLSSPAISSLGLSSGSASGNNDSSAKLPLHDPLDKNFNPSAQPQTGQNENNTGVSSAPGADAMMTPDFLLVSPSKGGPAPKPLQAFVGVSLKLVIERSDIVLDGLRGLMISVTNDTSRPLVIDGDSAEATVGSNNYLSASLPLVQKCVLPNNGLLPTSAKLVTNVVPALATVGAVPTVKDFIIINKPISKRYGADERRRLVEATRFGKRIVWPHQKTQGIIYFQTHNALTGARLKMSVHTLFDKPDSASLGS
jgi:hypothetical protein